MLWFVLVGFEPARPVDVEAAVDRVMDALPTVDGVAPSMSGTGDGSGLWTFSFCVEADTLKAASSSAQATFARVVHEALGVKVRARFVEVLDEAEFNRRLAEPLIPALVGIAEIAEHLGVSKARARELVTAGRIRQVATLASGPVCLASDLEVYAATPRRAGRPKKAVQEPAEVAAS